MFVNIINTIQTSFIESWSGFGNIVINIAIAIAFASAASVLSLLIARLVKKIVEVIRLEVLFEKIGVHSWFAMRGLNFSFTSFVYWTVKWSGILGSFIFLLRLLNLQTALIYLKALGGFVIKGMSAAVILLTGFFVANFVKDLLIGVSKAFRLDVKYGIWVSGFVKWGIVIFTLIFSMSEFQISESVFRSLLTAFLAMIALAGGIALGLSGKSWADRIIEKLRKDVE